MMIDKDQLYRFLDNIATLFGDRCEIVVHDFTHGFDETVVKIINGHVSGRSLEACPTSLFFEQYNRPQDIKEDTPCYFSNTTSGRLIKSSTTFLHDADGNVIGSICINFDITDFFNYNRMMSSFLGYNVDKKQPQPNEVYYRNVDELLDYYLELAEEKIGKPVGMMDKIDKMQALAFLDEKHVLQITKASVKLCEFFGISKFTLYHYLDEIRKEQEEK